MTSDLGVASSMAMILGTLIALLAGIVFLQTPSKSVSESTFIADPMTHKSKHAYEMFVLYYTPIWIGSFAIIVAFQLYESFTAWTYLYVCVGLSLPFLLQPLLLPSAGFGSPDANRPWDCRYATKANVWLAIYSFIGNYWYTHYFYTVLKAVSILHTGRLPRLPSEGNAMAVSIAAAIFPQPALATNALLNPLFFANFLPAIPLYPVLFLPQKYTMPAHRLNNVPIALYFATHFYFSTYHVFSNACLRKVVTTFEAGIRRQILFVSVVVVLSYFTAFMETLTISSFPYYSFEDRHTAYTVGSAFYGIYFLVSFPAFFAFNDGIDTNKQQPNLWDTVVSACGHGMLILILLDFVRLYLGIPLVVGEEESTADESITGYIAAYFASLWNSIPSWNPIAAAACLWRSISLRTSRVLLRLLRAFLFDRLDLLALSCVPGSSLLATSSSSLSGAATRPSACRTFAATAWSPPSSFLSTPIPCTCIAIAPPAYCCTSESASTLPSNCWKPRLNTEYADKPSRLSSSPSPMVNMRMTSVTRITRGPASIALWTIRMM